MKSFLVLVMSFAVTGLECAGEPSPSVSRLKSHAETIRKPSQEIDVFSIGRVFDEVKPITHESNSTRWSLYDDPQLMRDYQQKWETNLKTFESNPTPIFNPARTETLR